MKLWAPETDDGGFDLTPMIDIVFLLIVFFMTVANMLTAEKVSIEMPVADRANIPEDFGDRTTITIMRDGALYSGASPISKAQLQRVIAESLEENPQVSFYIRADRLTDHRHINLIMQLCADAGSNRVTFAAYQSDK